MTSGKFKWTSIDSAGVVVCIVLTAAAGWLGARPIWQRHTDFLQQELSLQSCRQENSRAGVALSATRARLQRVNHDLSQIPLHLQPATRLNNRLAAVTDLAARSKLKIEDIQPGVATRGRRYDHLDIRLAGEGKYSSCETFLHQLKQAMPDIGIQSLHLSAQSNSADQATFAITLQWFAAPSTNVAAAE